MLGKAHLDSSSPVKGSSSGGQGKIKIFNKLLKRKSGVPSQQAKARQEDLGGSVKAVTRPSLNDSLKKSLSSARNGLDEKVIERRASVKRPQPNRFPSAGTSTTTNTSTTKTSSTNVLNCIDDGESSIYNEELNDSNTLDDQRDSDLESTGAPSALLSSGESGITSSPLTSPPYVVPDNSYSKLNSLLPTNEHSFHDLPFESLQSPSYFKNFKRNKHSPKIFRNVFLAQEIRFEEKENKSDVLSDSIQSSLITEGLSEGTSEHDTLDDSTRGLKTEGNKNEIFVMDFSKDGKYLAAAGRDSTIKIWKVISSPLARLEFVNQEGGGPEGAKKSKHKEATFPSASIFHLEPVKIFRGHKSSVISLDWSKNNFLITGSMDKTVKLWHVDRDDCLDSFEHEDFVTCVRFHPLDDRFFLSGTLDNKARLWSILEDRVSYIRHLDDHVLITACAFTPDGMYCIVGGFNGSIFTLETKGLYVMHHVEVKDRSITSFHNKNDNKITGIKAFEASTQSDDMTRSRGPLGKWNFLITTNDSKIRLVHPELKKLVTRFKGHTNQDASIIADISDDHQYILCASEDHWCYVWENNNDIINNRLKVALKDLMIDGKNHIADLHKLKRKTKVFTSFSSNKKDGNNEEHYLIANENSSYSAFHAHHSSVNVAIFAPIATTSFLESSDDVIYQLAKRHLGAETAAAKNTQGVPAYRNSSYGYIIVSTDDKGLIRVFRQDSAHDARKQLEETVKNEEHNRARSTFEGDPRSALHSKSPSTRSANILQRKKSRNSRSSSLGTDIKKRALLNKSKRGGSNNLTIEAPYPRHMDSRNRVLTSSAIMNSAKNQTAQHSGTFASVDGNLNVLDLANPPQEEKDASFITHDKVARTGNNVEESRNIYSSSGANNFSNYSLPTPTEEGTTPLRVPLTPEKRHTPLIVKTNGHDGRHEVVNFDTPVEKTKGRESFESAYDFNDH